MEQYPSQIKPQFHLAQTIYQLRPHLSQMRTTKYMPFTRKKTFFLEKNMSQIRGRPPPPPPLNPPLSKDTSNVCQRLSLALRVVSIRHDTTWQVKSCHVVGNWAVEFWSKSAKMFSNEVAIEEYVSHRASSVCELLRRAAATTKSCLRSRLNAAASWGHPHAPGPSVEFEFSMRNSLSTKQQQQYCYCNYYDDDNYRTATNTKQIMYICVRLFCVSTFSALLHVYVCCMNATNTITQNYLFGNRSETWSLAQFLRDSLPDAAHRSPCFFDKWRISCIINCLETG